MLGAVTAADEPGPAAFAGISETGPGSAGTADADSPDGSVLLFGGVGVASGVETACGASETALPDTAASNTGAAPVVPISGVGAGTESEVAGPSSEATGIAATGTGTSGCSLSTTSVHGTSGPRAAPGACA